MVLNWQSYYVYLGPNLFKFGHSRTLFLYFSLFNSVDSKKVIVYSLLVSEATAPPIEPTDDAAILWDSVNLKAALL